MVSSGESQMAMGRIGFFLGALILLFNYSMTINIAGILGTVLLWDVLVCLFCYMAWPLGPTVWDFQVCFNGLLFSYFLEYVLLFFSDQCCL